MKKLILLTCAAILLAPAGALAVSENANTQSNGQSTSTSASDTTANQGVSGAIQNCEKIEARVQTKLQNYTAAKSEHSTAYANLLDRLEKFVVNIKAKGYDTTTLEADIAVLSDKIEEFNALADESYAQLQRTQTYTCGQAEGQFVKSLAQSRQQIRLAYRQAQDIHTFYRDVIRVDLLDLKTQTPSIVSSSENTNTESSNTEETDTNQETEE